ncbi:alpha/beta fold hydrolase [Mycolicibacterium stellerae]|uniref:alpha/beta fold hydrolase n=1 Tax=Mycolicibacterium stellerae TaxID=2358193 RepID=UPI00228584FE|nr:alpha/beta hydrolase [Mycolicibacterium stellerae]
MALEFGIRGPGVTLSTLSSTAQTGVPLVLLHPLGSTGAMTWASLAASLRGAGYRVATPDLPGHGSLRDAPFTWEDASTTIRAAAESFAPDKPVLVGHSLGAAAAIYAAQRMPGSFAGLVLSGAGACWKDRYVRCGLTVAAALGALSAAVGRRELLAHAAGIRGANIVTAARAADVAPVQLWRAARRLVRFDVRNTPPPPIPCAVIVLTDDRRMPPGLQRGLVRYLGAPYVDVAGDHDAPVRQADRFFDGVQSALALLGVNDATRLRRPRPVALVGQQRWERR